MSRSYRTHFVSSLDTPQSQFHQDGGVSGPHFDERFASIGLRTLKVWDAGADHRGCAVLAVSPSVG